VCQDCSVIPKKNWGCNRCQRCFNKVLRKGSEYLCKMWYFQVCFTIHLQKCLKTCFCCVIIWYFV
jgi:hypothetical protein